MFVLILSCSSFAAVENYNDVDSLWINLNIDSNIELTKNSESASLEHITTELTLVPMNDVRQTVENLNIISEPEAQIEEGTSILYKWNNINNNYKFGLDGTIKTSNLIYPIPNSKFPMLSIDSSLRQYLEPTDNIDVNDDILTKASSLAQGKDNLFEVTFVIADWVNTNIKYDLNTLTATAVQKSSWVLENREGVCDEITSLFISMLRSIGIPARFVSGMVYTNLNYDFGNHGWAEVYFDEYGWVPFDVTFGQYGWIDPSHVKLSDSVDSATYSAKYKWKSYGLSIEPKDLKLKSSVTSVGSKIQSPYNIEVSMIEDQVGPGSYVPIRISVENPLNHYASTSISIIKAPQLIDKNVKQVLLKPKSRSDVFCLIKVPENLDPDYLYTADISIKDSFGQIKSTSLDYSASYDKISRKEAEDTISSYTKISERTYSEFISLKCQSDKKYYYIYEKASITCNVKNKTNRNLNNINLCLVDNCKTVNVDMGNNVDVIFDLDLSNFTTQTIVADVEIEKNHVNDFISLKVYKKPVLVIDNVNYNEIVSYNENFELSFHLSSQTPINDVIIKVNGNSYSSINTLSGTQKVLLPLKGEYVLGKPLKLEIDYQDENGRKYKNDEEYNISVINLPWYAKIISFFKIVFN